jgi:hypothetical protein
LTGATHGTTGAYPIDGNTNGNFGSSSTTHTDEAIGRFWQVTNLQGNTTDEFAIANIVVFGRSDCCQSRLSNFDVEIFNPDGTAYSITHTTQVPTTNSGPQTNPPAGFNFVIPNNRVGDTVRVTQNIAQSLSLAEVQIFGDSSLELSGDALNLEIGSGGNDFVNVEGTATIDGAVNVTFLAGSDAELNDVFDLIAASSIDSSGANLSVTGYQGLGNVFTLQTVDDGSGGQLLQLVITPEPASIAIWAMIAGIAGCGFYVRRRRK